MANWSTLNDEKKVWENTYPVKKYYTVQDVSSIMGAGSTSVYGAIKRGTLKAYKVNGVVHVKHEDLVAYKNQSGTAQTYDIDDLVIEPYNPAAEDAEEYADGDLDDDGLDFLDN